MDGLGSFPFARHYLGNHCYFLFLCLLRCFSSAGLRTMCDWSSTSQVSPFGNRRIKSYLLIPSAYRSLSRPSSPPRAKASPVYSFLLSSTHMPFAPYGVLFLINCQTVPSSEYQVSRPGPATRYLILDTEQQRLYCCLLFFFNFFQYVKELSGVVSCRLQVVSWA